MSRIFIGIDPGKSGGIAFLRGSKIRAFKMPSTVRDIVDLFRKHAEGRDAFAVLEKVSARPGDGNASMFKFGTGFGVLQGVLSTLEIPYEMVTPRKWQKEFGLIVPASKKLTKPEKKNLNKAEAQRLFPGRTIIHATADALLLAEWCRRHKGG